MNIEFVQGQESHTSTWGKFYVKGLEDWQVKEDFEENCHDKHHSYQGFVCLDIPEGTVFTIFAQSGDKRGTEDYRFYICKTSFEINKITGYGWINGNFQIIAEGLTRTKAPRLMAWWTESADHSLQFAEHCAAHIDKRGLKTLPQLTT